MVEENFSANQNGANTNEDHSKMEIIKRFALQYCRMESSVSKGQLNDLINIIRSEEFSKSMFIETINNIEDCQKICNQMSDGSSSLDGFEEIKIESVEKLYSSTIYVRDIVQVLRFQIRNANEEDLLLEPVERTNDKGVRAFSHLMETNFGKEIYNHVKDKVLSSTDPSVIWYEQPFSDQMSFSGILQMYSDKSAVTLRKNGISAYPVHINFLNFKYPEWRRQILKERTLVAYLPVEIVKLDDEDEKKLKRN